MDTKVLTSPERWHITLFFQLARIWQLFLHYVNWNTMTGEMKIIFNNVLLMCLHVKNFSSVFYIIFGLASGWSFTPIILLHIQVKFCLAVTNHLKSIFETPAKNGFVCSRMHFVKIQLHYQGCFILQILLSQSKIYEIF